MYDKTKTNSAGRVFLLLLIFVCAAVSVYSLPGLLSPDRYILTPAKDLPVTPVMTVLYGYGFDIAADRLAVLTGTALELFWWFLGGLSICAGPVFLLASVCRGASFGFVLSLIAGEGAGSLAGWHMLSLAGWIAVTVLLFLFAGKVSPPTSGKAFCRYAVRFLSTAGAAFWITALCSTASYI